MLSIIQRIKPVFKKKREKMPHNCVFPVSYLDNRSGLCYTNLYANGGLRRLLFVFCFLNLYQYIKESDPL